MSKHLASYVERELSLLSNQIISICPKKKVPEVEKLFLDKISLISTALTKKSYYIRNFHGIVTSYDTIEEAAEFLKIRPTTLACYLSNKSFIHVKNNTISKVPLAEHESSNPNLDPNTIWIRYPSGLVEKVNDLEKAAKILHIGPRTLYNYLSRYKGTAATKYGLASKYPLSNLTFIENFELEFSSKHGRLPYDHEYPRDPNDKRRY